MEERLHDIVFGRDFLGVILKVHVTKEEIQSNLSKLKPSVHQGHYHQIVQVRG